MYLILKNYYENPYVLLAQLNEKKILNHYQYIYGSNGNHLHIPDPPYLVN